MRSTLAAINYSRNLRRHSSSLNSPANNDQKPPLFATSSSYPDDKRVFFFDIDNCLYPKTSGIPHLMKARYFERLAHRYYVDYGLAIRGLVEKHPAWKYNALNVPLLLFSSLIYASTEIEIQDYGKLAIIQGNTVQGHNYRLSEN
ncbi:hypothetical protein BGZ47_006994 [Haplosporangium gracile]|nr:hypothetical protein BGZ47_006994 [Haplosporangium gracile]